jgi:DNA-binding NarL/FixJ family response regulator
MMAAKKDTKFKPGQSGNPSGRTPGSGWVTEARKALEKEWNGDNGIKSVLVKKAKEGDMGAIRLVAERVCPPIKAAEPAVPIELPPGTLTQRATAVLDSLARGEMNTTQASQLMQALGALARVIETDELEKRIKALEEAKP